MILEASTLIKARPEAVFRYFDEMKTPYLAWHPDHVRFRCERGRGAGLDACGETETVRRRHTQYFLALAEQIEPELEITQSATSLSRLEAEHDNLRAALHWALERSETAIALRLVAALWRFWWIRGHFSASWAIGQGW